MIEAPEFQQLTPSLWLWQAFDPAVKAELFSTAVVEQDALYLVDPIPLAPSARTALKAGRQIAGVLVTSSNHLRQAGPVACAEDVPIYAAEPITRQLRAAKTHTLTGGDMAGGGITAIAIEGAADGEMAFHFAGNGGTIVLGDAVINLDPYGFSLLPAKYCAAQKIMRRSLRQLLDFSFGRLLFAHGMPVLASARTRLEILLR